MINMKMSEGGRLVVPMEIRQAMSLKEGDTVSWEFKNGIATLTTKAQRMKQAQALVQSFGNPGECWTDELIAERRKEAANE
jgi:antitoxin component of MazEF toxin-antitoxin module